MSNSEACAVTAKQVVVVVVGDEFPEVQQLPFLD